MTRFLDGPAAGHTLWLKRAPLFLRVTITPNGHVDALDQLDDFSLPDERIHVYRREGKGGTLHIKTTNKGALKSGTYATADYAYVTDGPADAVMRDNDQWREWVTRRVAAEAATHGCD